MSTTAEQTMSLAEIILAEKSLAERLEQLRDDFRVSESGMVAEANALSEMRDAAGYGVDVEKLQVAKAIIQVYGTFADVGDRRQMVEAAIADIAGGGTKLRTRYFGCKNYDRWSSQREDHEYGYGPRHGSIVFSISKRSDPESWSPEQIEAAIYCLLAMLDGKAVPLK